MRAPSLSAVLLGVVLAGSAVLSSGCFVGEEEPPAYAYGYEPQYYDGYVVYYDEGGRPFYYEGGAVVLIPPTSPVYVGLVNHWRWHGGEYHAWYSHHGYRYRGYRGYRGRR